MTYDVTRVRSWFPALQGGTAYFDGPGGSQTPQQVATAVADAMTAGLSNRGSVTAGERAADTITLGARAAVADLLGAHAGGIVFGRSMTALTYELAHTLSSSWGPGDEVVVTNLDHDANIRPWVQAAAAAGATLVWAELEPATGELPLEAITSVLSGRTRVLALTGASNVLGTRPDVAAAVAAAHAVGALVFVDGVHLTPHAAVDAAALGADVYACSPYKFFGPHLGVLAAAPSFWETLAPNKLLPSSNAVPERFELGTLPYELLAGTTAAVDTLADLDPEATGTRRARVLTSMAAAEAHEEALFTRLLEGVSGMGHLTRHGRPAHATPTLWFSVDGHTGAQVHAHLAGLGINAPASNFYAIEASRALGLGD
ncbi:MAG: cysteine desulfurase-like protein, partial [Mycobacteriaceae bacterium]